MEVRSPFDGVRVVLLAFLIAIVNAIAIVIGLKVSSRIRAGPEVFLSVRPPAGARDGPLCPGRTRAAP